MSPEVLIEKSKLINYGAVKCLETQVDKEQEQFHKFGMKSDMWAIGVIAYILVC